MTGLILAILTVTGAATTVLRRLATLRPPRRLQRRPDPLPVRMHRRWYVTSAPNRHRV
ncbi:hypothetical protein [Endothiovibrio diazotrophicus]